MSQNFNKKTRKYDIQFKISIDGSLKHIHRRSVSSSKKEARRIEQELKESLKGKKHSTTFYELHDKRMQWLLQTGKSNSTVKTYDDIVKNHFRPFLLNKEISKYTKSDLNLFLEKLSDNERSNNTVNNCIGILKADFNYASKNGFLSNGNPTSELSFYKTIKRRQPYIFSFEEYRRFIDVCKRIEKDPLLWEAIWTTFFELGLRKSELEPIQVKDINFVHHSISISKHLVSGQGKVRIEPGRKNGEGYDAIMTDHLASLLKKRIEDLKKYDGFSDEAYLFNVDGIFRPASRTTLKRHLDMTCEAGGFPKTTVHMWRKACIYNMISIGADTYTCANHIKDTVELIEKVYGGRIQAHNYARDLLNEQNRNNQKE